MKHNRWQYSCTYKHCTYILWCDVMYGIQKPSDFRVSSSDWSMKSLLSFCSKSHYYHRTCRSLTTSLCTYIQLREVLHMPSYCSDLHFDSVFRLQAFQVPSETERSHFAWIIQFQPYRTVTSNCNGLFFSSPFKTLNTTFYSSCDSQIGRYGNWNLCKVK